LKNKHALISKSTHVLISEAPIFSMKSGLRDRIHGGPHAVFYDVFGLTSLHFGAALLQNSIVKQLYFRGLVKFSKKGVASFRNEVL
jgi:hypothetical protein